MAAATIRRLCGRAPSNPGVLIVRITVSSRGLLTNFVEKNPCQLYAPGPPSQCSEPAGAFSPQYGELNGSAHGPIHVAAMPA